MLDDGSLLIDVGLLGLRLLDYCLERVNSTVAVFFDFGLRFFDELLTPRDLVDVLLHLIYFFKQVLGLCLFAGDCLVVLLLHFVHVTLVLHLEGLFILVELSIFGLQLCNVDCLELGNPVFELLRLLRE